VLTALLNDSTPVLAVLISASHDLTKVYGFVDSITEEAGLVVCTSQGTPSMSSAVVSVSIEDCKFSMGTAPDEAAELKYGDTSLHVHLPSGARLTLFFTAKPSPK